MISVLESVLGTPKCANVLLHIMTNRTSYILAAFCDCYINRCSPNIVSDVSDPSVEVAIVVQQAVRVGER